MGIVIIRGYSGGLVMWRCSGEVDYNKMYWGDVNYQGIQQGGIGYLRTRYSSGDWLLGNVVGERIGY